MKHKPNLEVWDAILTKGFWLTLVLILPLIGGCSLGSTDGETLSSLALSENFFAVFLADGDERGRKKE